MILLVQSLLPPQKKAWSPESQEKEGFPGFLGKPGVWKSLESQEFTLGFHGKPRICLKSKKSHEKPGLLKIFLSLSLFEGKAGVTNCSAAKNS